MHFVIQADPFIHEIITWIGPPGKIPDLNWQISPADLLIFIYLFTYKKSQLV